MQELPNSTRAHKSAVAKSRKFANSFANTTVTKQFLLHGWHFHDLPSLNVALGLKLGGGELVPLLPEPDTYA